MFTPILAAFGTQTIAGSLSALLIRVTDFSSIPRHNTTAGASFEFFRLEVEALFRLNNGEKGSIEQLW
jgi:hypothetical protein